MHENEQVYFFEMCENIRNIAMYMRMQTELKVAAALDSNGLGSRVVANKLRKELKMDAVDPFSDPKFDSKGGEKSGE